MNHWIIPKRNESLIYLPPGKSILAEVPTVAFNCAKIFLISFGDPRKNEQFLLRSLKEWVMDSAGLNTREVHGWGTCLEAHSVEPASFGEPLCSPEHPYRISSNRSKRCTPLHHLLLITECISLYPALFRTLGCFRGFTVFEFSSSSLSNVGITVARQLNDHSFWTNMTATVGCWKHANTFKN